MQNLLKILIKMDWTSIYLKTSTLNVFILGTGEVATRRANKFLDHGANVKLAGNDLSDDLTDKGISGDKLINRADYPLKGNVIVPTSFNIADIEISIFTNGKSPLMARQLRKKIQSIITEEDILEIELQDYARSKLKGAVENQKERRKYLYEIFEDEKINEFIDNRQIDEAKLYIDNLIRGLN